MTAEGAPELHDTAERRLRRIDQRYTAGRRAIIELLVNAGHPVSIGDIAESLPDLPRSSAYRHLTEHHHHLLCVNCGKVSDVTMPPTFEHQVAEAIGQLAAAEGFQPQSHRLDVLGVCASCH